MPRARPPNAGKGRKKGSTNVLTREIKAAIENAFVELGGEKYLVRLGKKQPAVFAQLLGKLLPTKLTGADGGALKLDVNHRSSPAALQRADELIARAIALGSNRGAEKADPNGSVLPAEVRAAANGHRAPVDAGADQ